MVVFLVCNTAISISVVGRPNVVWVLLITLPAELWLNSTEKEKVEKTYEDKCVWQFLSSYGTDNRTITAKLRDLELSTLEVSRMEVKCCHMKEPYVNCIRMVLASM